MPLALHRTDNKRWRCAKPYPSMTGGERVQIFTFVLLNPDCTTDFIKAGLSGTQSRFPAEALPRIPSRLAELERAGYLISTYDGDLFA